MIDPRFLHAVDTLQARIAAYTRTSGTGCRFWQGAVSQSGFRGCFYPVLRVGARVWRVNRLVKILAAVEETPPHPEEPLGAWLDRINDQHAGLDASHSCDQSLCVAGEHLAWETHRFNVRAQARRRQEARVA